MSNRRVIFETERLVVRLYDLNDEESFFLLNSDEEVVRYIRPVKTRDECNLFLREVINYAEANPLLGRWAVDEKFTGRNIGLFAIFPIDKTDKIQLGYSLLKDSWGKGYSTELTRKGITYFFKNLRKEKLYAITEALNVASQRVLEKCGFTLSERHVKEGKEVLEYRLSKPDKP